MNSAARRLMCYSIPFAVAALWAFLPSPLTAQRRSDPLTQAEIDQLRDTAQEADLRLKLYVTFARDRLDALVQLRSDPKIKDRAEQTHDKLQEFLDVYDELNENVDTFAARGADLRKVLKNIIEADTEFQAKLRAIKDSSSSNPAEVSAYEFLLGSALETLDGSVEDHRQLLAEQQEAAKHKKKPSH